jgi:hypothetical protein
MNVFAPMNASISNQKAVLSGYMGYVLCAKMATNMLMFSRAVSSLGMDLFCAKITTVHLLRASKM